MMRVRIFTVNTTNYYNIIQTIDKIVNIRLPSDPRFMLLGDDSILQFDQRKN